MLHLHFYAFFYYCTPLLSAGQNENCGYKKLRFILRTDFLSLESKQPSR
jgi:hypothetical protein